MSKKLSYRDSLQEQVKSRIGNDLANHEVHQLHADGALGRLWRCKKPGTSSLAFTVCAPPGWLIVYGDMGECMWSRLYDMLPFVRSAINDLHYFSQKASKECKIKDSPAELIEEWLKEYPKEHERDSGQKMTKEEREKLADVRSSYEQYEDPHDFCRALYESGLVDGGDMPNLTFYTYHYLWLVEALKWWIAKIDAGEVIKEEFSWPEKDPYN